MEKHWWRIFCVRFRYQQFGKWSITMKNFAIIALFACFAFPSQVKADEPSIGCQAVALGVGIAAGVKGYTLATGMTIAQASAYISSYVTAGVSGFLGQAALSETCQSFVDTVHNNLTTMSSIPMSPEAYQEFVDTYCGGQPFACQGNLSIGNPLGSLTPEQCAAGPLHIDCALSTIHMTRPIGNSVNDILGSLAFISISTNANYWQIENYGYLVGIHVHDPDPPGHWEPQ